jgi:hypothetical protein
VALRQELQLVGYGRNTLKCISRLEVPLPPAHAWESEFHSWDIEFPSIRSNSQHIAFCFAYHISHCAYVTRPVPIEHNLPRQVKLATSDDQVANAYFHYDRIKEEPSLCFLREHSSRCCNRGDLGQVRLAWTASNAHTLNCLKSRDALCSQHEIITPLL